MVKVTQINESKESGGKQPYQQNRVFDAEGLSPTIDQSAGRFSVMVKSATKNGFEIASEGDSVNMSVPNSATSRGRVGKQQAQTLDTASNQAVILQTGRGYNNGGEHEDCPTISANSFHNNNHVKVSPILTPDRLTKRQNGGRFKEQGADSFTITAQDKHGIIEESKKGVSIRRLTEIEVERLQGFEDNHTEFGLYPTVNIGQKKFNEMPNEERIKLFENTVKKKVSSTQRYKQCGNAVTVDIVHLITSKL